MAKIKKDLLFIAAACKSREKFLLSEDKYMQLISCGSLSEAYKLLKEFGFVKSDKELDLKSLIFEEEEDLSAFIREYSPGGGTDAYFLLPYDFLNAEAILKCKMLGLDEQKYLTHEGLFTISQLKKSLDGEDVFPEIDAALKKAAALFEGNPTGAMVDAVFSSFMYKALERVVKDESLQKLIKTEADLKNISAAIRCKDKEEYLSLKIPVGTLSEKMEAALLQKNADLVSSSFYGTPLYEYAIAALKEAGGRLTDFEKLKDGYMLKTLKLTKYFNIKREPFLLYVFYRKADIANVRLILVGIQNQMDKDLLKSMLRESY